MARVEPFDDVKVAVKRSEVDWLNIAPSASWFGRVGTKLIKLCKGIWWSVRILASGCEVESLLQLEGARRVSSPLRHVITNAPFWSGNTEILLEVVVDQFFRALSDSVCWVCWYHNVLHVSRRTSRPWEVCAMLRVPSTVLEGGNSWNTSCRSSPRRW